MDHLSIFFIFDAFATFSIRDFVDILIVTTLLYLALIFIKQTRSFFIFSAIVILAGVSYLSILFNLTVTKVLFQPFLTFFILIFVIVFQRELRRFFEWFTLFGRRFTFSRNQSHITSEVAQDIVEAVSILTQKKIGAIIVIAGDHPLEHSMEGGTLLNGNISVPLLLSIFDNHTPGHDGAMIIAENKIQFFGVHLPLARSSDELNKYGTRHRAAVGMSEETDALVIVISEERGIVSIARNGVLREVSRNEFSTKIEAFVRVQLERTGKKNVWKYLLLHNWTEKIISIFLAIILWLIIS